jgi:hypothetical protein
MSLPDELKISSWDLVVCSDVLYESSVHSALAAIVRTLNFSTLLLTYKRRHDTPEQAFLNQLELDFHVTVVPGSVVADWQGGNLSEKLATDLYAFIVRPRVPAGL